MLLDWTGDILPLLTGRQSCKLGVAGGWGTECSCWWLGRAFLSLTAERGIYMSCCIHFYPLSLWQIHHALIFLAEICQFFMVVKLSWKDPWKPLPILKVSRVIERKIWQINFSFLLSVGSGGKKTRKYLGGWEKLSFSNQKTFFRSVPKIKTLTDFLDLMISRRKCYCNFSASQCH